MLYPSAFASRRPSCTSRSTNISRNWETKIRRIPESSSIRSVIEEASLSRINGIRRIPQYCTRLEFDVMYSRGRNRTSEDTDF